MFYALTITICMIIISVLNIIFNTFNLTAWYIILAVVVNTICVIIVDGIFAFIIRWIFPTKWFNYDNKHFFVGKKECLFYEKLGIKAWKDKVLELGCFTKFRKNKVYDPKNNEYIERFIMESNSGFVIHLVCCVVGFLIVFIYPLKYAFCFAVPVAIVNFVLHLMPAMILRYNNYRLSILHKYNERSNGKIN